MSVDKLVGWLLSYLTCIVFILGIAYRVSRWNRASVTRMPLFPIPSGRAQKWSQIAKEVLIFKGPLDGDKSLWIGTWIFHATLALVLVGHLGIVTDFPRLWNALAHKKGEIDAVAAIASGCAGVILMATGLYLLFRRLAVLRVREISSFEDYASIALVLAVVLTGDIMRFGSQFDLNPVREYLKALFSLRSAPVPSDPWFLLHFFLAQLLIMYIPFSKFLHIPGIFYSKSLLWQK